MAMAAFVAAVFMLAPAVTAQDSDARDGLQDTVKNDTSRSVAPGGQSERSSDYAIKPWRSLRGHLHNKIIHVPIGFSLAAFLLSLLSFRSKDLEPAVRWLVLVAALGALAAYVSGGGQAEEFEGGAKEWVVEIHERLGIATACALWVWTISLWVAPLKRWAFPIGLLAVVLLLATGFFGGIVAHG